MVFCNLEYNKLDISQLEVTILILIDGFLQLMKTRLSQNDLYESQSLF